MRSELDDIIKTHSKVLPSVTLEMLLDHFSDHQIMSVPQATAHDFRWFWTLSKNDTSANLLPDMLTDAPPDVSSNALPNASSDTPSRTLDALSVAPSAPAPNSSDTLPDPPSDTPPNLPDALPDSKLLYIAHMDAAHQLLQQQLYAFVLVLAIGDHLPNWLAQFKNRVLVLRQKETLSYFTVLVQQFFVQQLIWESQLDRVVYQDGSLNDICEVGCSLLHNFISVVDKDMNLLGYSKSIAPPDSFLAQLVKTGCAPHDITDLQKHFVKRKGISLIEATPESPFKKLYCPIFVQGSYFGSVLMSCTTRSYSLGLEDIFNIFLKRLTMVCTSHWRKRIKVEAPHYFFFSKLLSGNTINDAYVYEQMRLTKIPHNPQLKLIVLELNEQDWINRQQQIIKAASKINHGNCYQFPHNGDLLILCYAEDSDSQLSHRKTTNDLSHLIHQPFGLTSGVSQIFENICDLDMAYKQTKVALSLKNTIQNELYAVDEQHDKSVFLFEDALIYCLLSEANPNQRFMRFSFSHTLLQKIHQEDIANNTNYVALFWFYLHHERNATLVAKRLHMHRNTVLYHIDKLQKRFDFDLSLQSAREKMLLDFKTFFLTSGHESVKRVFDTLEDN
ncbi:MAG: helix-turn-helix domain-containing protein [Coriobacteriales bacterium]|jgi:sugar diacid utilization regulator|nr:helix-turn-helix domain-containing protein [Coriobacteriales bacterium]